MIDSTFFGRLLSKTKRHGSAAGTPATLLDPNSYDAAEGRAKARMSIPALMAFQPATFGAVGYPTRVEETPELLRYIDHNFEAETANLFKPGAEFPPVGYRNAFCEDERQLIQRVRDKVATLTEARYGRRIRPISNILVQTGPLRAVEGMRALADLEPADTTVFEVGAGAGYLGALLAERGYRYQSYDVTQALYLWQSHLLAMCAGDDFREFVGDDDAPIGAARVGHFPWWRFSDMLGAPPFSADIVYSNSNLGEMSSLSLHFVLHISKQMLAQSPLGIFCFFSEGMQMQNSAQSIADNLKAYGFIEVFDSPFKAYAVTEEAAKRLRAAFKDGLAAYNPSGGPETLTARDLVPTAPEEYPLDIQITRWLHGWTPP